jgi:hypothetical protein
MSAGMFAQGVPLGMMMGGFKENEWHKFLVDHSADDRKGKNWTEYLSKTLSPLYRKEHPEVKSSKKKTSVKKRKTPVKKRKTPVKKRKTPVKKRTTSKPKLVLKKK